MGGIIGAVFGGATTYFVQRKLEAKRKHDKTLRNLYNKLQELRSLFFTVLLPGVTDGEAEPLVEGVYPQDIYNLAKEIKMLATSLDDKNLKRRVLETMTGEFDSRDELEREIIEILHEVREQAYPVLHDVKEDNRRIEVQVKVDNEGQMKRIKRWGGPATYKFLERVEEMGVKMKPDD